MSTRAILKATVAFTILVGLAGPANADPVITPIVSSIIGATIAGSTTAAAVATFVVTTALEYGAAVGLSKFASLFEHAPERQAQVQQLALGESPKDLIFGTALTGGALADAFNYGGDNGTDWEVRRIWLSCHKSDLVGFWVNNFYIPYTGDGVVPDVTGRPAFNGQLAVYFRPGTLDQVPPSDLAAAGGYTAADNAAGTAEVWVAYKTDKADAKHPVWQGGRPQFKWLVRGKRCYDPRKDSTVAGGSGAHRWADPTTWEYTRNPIVCRYNWARGIYAGDQVDKPEMLLLGRGLSAVEAPPERIIAWANLCDEQVAQRYLSATLVQDASAGDHSIKLSSADGIINGSAIVLSRDLSNQETVSAFHASGSDGLYTVQLNGALTKNHLHNDAADWESDADSPAMRPRYALDGVLHSDETFETQEALFAATCAGRLIQPEGGIEVEPGYAKVPVFSITDDDLVGRAPVAWSDFGSSASRVNTIIPSFTDPAQLFENHAAPVRRSTDDIAADGGPKEEPLSLDLVTVLAQAQELGEIERHSRRFERTCTIVLPPLYSGVEEGDWFNYASARRAAGLTLTWEVVSWTVDAKRRTTITAREVSAAIFERDGMVDELPPTGGNLPSATPPDAVIPQTVVLDSYTESGASGRKGPSATITFDPPGYAAVSKFLVEYRVLGTLNSLFAYTDEVSGGTLTLPGLIPDTTYEWRYRYIVTSGAPTPWSDWFTFKTDDVRVSRIDFDATAKSLLDFIGPSMTDLLDRIHAVSQGVAEAGLGASADMQGIRRSVQSVGRLTASFDERITVATDDVAALAEEVTTLNSSLAGKADATAVSALETLVEDHGDSISVLSAEYTSLSATVDGVTSSLSTVESALDALADDQGATADSLTSLSAQYGLSIATARMRIGVAATKPGMTATIGFSISTTDGGGAVDEGAFFLSTDGTTSSFWGNIDQFIVSNGSTEAALSSALEFVDDTLFVKNAAIQNLDAGKITVGTLDVETLIVSGSLTKGYLASQSGTVTPSATVATEIVRETVTSLGGTISVICKFAQVSKADSGSYVNCVWELRATSVGTGSGTTINSGTYFSNDAGELWRTVFGNVNAGAFPYGQDFDVVLYITGDGSKRPVIGNSQIQAIAMR